MLKKIILAAVGAVCALSVGAAGAYFTGQVQVPDSIIRAGSVSMSVDPTSAVLSVDPLAPGENSVHTMTITNTGVLPADLVVSASKKAGSTEFYEALTCRLQGEGRLLYSGSLSGLRTAGIRLGRAQSMQLCFTIGLPAEAGNALAGEYAKVSLYFDSEQAH